MTIPASAANDVALAKLLNKQAAEHDAAALAIRQERRQVWLRLHEVHGMTFTVLEDVLDFGSTTLSKELKKARTERDDGAKA